MMFVSDIDLCLCYVSCFIEMQKRQLLCTAHVAVQAVIGDGGFTFDTGHKITSKFSLVKQARKPLPFVSSFDTLLCSAFSSSCMMQYPADTHLA